MLGQQTEQRKTSQLYQTVGLYPWRSVRNRTINGNAVARFSGPIAHLGRHAPLSLQLDVQRLEVRIEHESGYCMHGGSPFLRWCTQEDSNLQPRSGPERTPGISRPLCQLSYGCCDGQGERIRTSGLVRPRHTLLPC
jgi:hypothetical protein